MPTTKVVKVRAVGWFGDHADRPKIFRFLIALVNTTSQKKCPAVKRGATTVGGGASTT